MRLSEKRCWRNYLEDDRTLPSNAELYKDVHLGCVVCKKNLIRTSVVKYGSTKYNCHSSYWRISNWNWTWQFNKKVEIIKYKKSIVSGSAESKINTLNTIVDYMFMLMGILIKWTYLYLYIFFIILFNLRIRLGSRVLSA